MGLSTVTPKSFNSTGAQSVCRANQPKADVPIESQFLTQCGLEYIHGAGKSVVRGSLGSLPKESKADSVQNVDMFFLESDVDAISGVDLTVSLTFPTINLPFDGTLTYLPSSCSNTVSKDFLLSIIDRIEVRIGGLTVQRILPEEIWQRNMTEQGYTSINDWLDSVINCQCKNNIGGNQLIENYTIAGGTPTDFLKTRAGIEARVLNHNQKKSPITSVQAGETVSWTLSLPIIGRTNDMHECFLQAGATSNSIVIAVYYKQVIPEAHNQVPKVGTASLAAEYGRRGVASLLRIGRDNGFPTTGPYTAEKVMDELANSYQSYLTVTNHSFTNTEADFCQQNIVNKIITASQSVVREVRENEIVKPSDILTPYNGVSLYTGKTIVSAAVLIGDLMTSPAATSNTSMPNYGYFKAYLGSAAPPAPMEQFTYEDKALIPITINLDEIDINTSHLLVSAFASTHRTDGTVSVTPLETISSGCQVVTAGVWSNLLIGSGNPYGCGAQIPLGSTQTAMPQVLSAMTTQTYNYSGFSHADKSGLYGPTGMEMRGALSDYIQFIEVIIGSDRSGRMPANDLLVSSGTFGLTKNDAPIYAIPLADRPFSTSGVPMSRVGTKQVVLYLDPRYAVDYGPFTQVDGNYANASLINGATANTKILSQDSLLTTDTISCWAPITKVAVTAVGTRVQTTVGGTTAFAS